MAKQFPEMLDGQILVTVVLPNPTSEDQRRHLAQMNMGEYALVESWIAELSHQRKACVYSVCNRIGSPTYEQALARFQRWLQTDA